MSAKKFDHILVVDLEATCYENDIFPEGETSEIIEIGIAELEISSGKILRNESILVRPTRSRVSNYCTELTSLTYKQLKSEGCANFPQAVRRLIKGFGPKKRIWAAWGNSDKWKFESDCKHWEIKYPFGSTYINIKDLYSLYCRMRCAMGLEKVLTKENIPKDGRAHRGYVDAKWAAMVLSRILWKGDSRY